jgi:hypothetical protein
VSDQWRRRAETDAPSAFRAVVRAAIEGAEGAEDSPGNQSAAIIFGLLTQGDPAGLAPVLARLIVAVNRDDFAAESDPDPEQSMGAYGLVFIEQFFEAGEAFRKSTGSVGDFLDAGSREEERVWRNALAAIAPSVSGTAQPRVSPSNGVVAAPRLVVYQYCVSLGIVSFKRSSGIKAVQPGAGAFLAGLPYTLVSLCFGWWGIPWGPIWTLQTIGQNLAGGKDVTALVAAASA